MTEPTRLTDPDKAALRARGVLGPLVSGLALISGSLFGVEIDADTQALIVNQTVALITGGLVLAGAVLGIIGRWKARSPIKGLLGLALVLLLSGCATHVKLWPPEVDVALGDAYAGYAADCGSGTDVDCSNARGGHLSSEGRRFLEGTVGAVRGTAGALLGLPAPAAGTPESEVGSETIVTTPGSDPIVTIPSATVRIDPNF